MGSLGHARSAPRRWSGIVPVVAAFIFSATCSDRPPVAPRSVAAGHAVLALRPSFSQVTGGPQIELSTLHAVLTAEESGARVEQDGPFTDGAATVTLEAPISGASARFSLDLSAFDTDGALAYTSSASGLVLRAGETVTPEIPPLRYAGSDSAVDYLVITSGSFTLTTLETKQLSVEAWISEQEQQISPVRVGWTSRDLAVARVDQSGLLTAGPNPGTTTIVATTATGVTDSITVDVRGKPVGIIVHANPSQVLVGKAAILSANYVDVAGNDLGPAAATFGTIVRGASIFGDTLIGSAIGLVPVVGAADTFADTINVAVVGAMPEMVVFGDAQLFNDNAFNLDVGGQQTFLFGLLRFQGTGPRADQSGVMLYRGHESVCGKNGACGIDSLRTLTGILSQNNYYPIDTPDSTGDVLTRPIDPQVRALIILTPATAFTPAEIGVLKQFALEGGRLVLVGESDDVYGSSVGVENQFLAAMGADVRANATRYSCGESTPPWVIPTASIRDTPITGDVTSLAIICASDMTVGQKDTPVIYDAANTHVLVALAAIDVSGAFLPSDGIGRRR